MFEIDGDSQSDFGLTTSKAISGATTSTACHDPWTKVTQLEFSLSRMERLPQSFLRVAQFLRDGYFQEGDNLLRHCLETLSQIFAQYPLNTVTPQEIPASVLVGVSCVLTRKNESLNVIREICQLREAKELDSIADCIEDELIVKLKSWESALRFLLQKLSSEQC